ncbi:MAG TPA: hypothetical protein VGX76_19435 [Pirellulales bacterium]|nr:hypothetical protein [Pirellulales bacterium]
MSTMLPTTFGRAFGVALCQLLIGAIIVVALVIVFLVLGLAVGGLRR